ncbi:uncharacterized protein LOC143208166 [Lasioglossum baleicum]|uniref:uncharacterized protein LOC143208166 n=1 Tax=Lasioglossum baleicum TaxID=434251 RepID=UPI003FCC4F08
MLSEKIIALDGRFDHVHVDIVGPLPLRNGMQYLLAMIDRFSRWVEAVPLSETVLSLIGCDRIWTTAYHPSSNSLIERWHRPLKAALMCHRDKDWTRSLSTVLLGLRSHVRSDTNASPAEFVFGTTLRLPGEFFLPDDFTPDPNIFIEEHREHMRQDLRKNEGTAAAGIEPRPHWW